MWGFTEWQAVIEAAGEGLVSNKPKEYGPPAPHRTTLYCKPCDTKWWGLPGTSCFICGDPERHPDPGKGGYTSDPQPPLQQLLDPDFDI